MSRRISMEEEVKVIEPAIEKELSVSSSSSSSVSINGNDDDDDRSSSHSDRKDDDDEDEDDLELMSNQSFIASTMDSNSIHGSLLDDAEDDDEDEDEEGMFDEDGAKNDEEVGAIFSIHESTPSDKATTPVSSSSKSSLQDRRRIRTLRFKLVRFLKTTKRDQIASALTSQPSSYMNAEAFAAELNELQARIGKRQFRTLNLAFREYLTQRRNKKMKSQSAGVEGAATSTSTTEAVPPPSSANDHTTVPGHVVSRVSDPTPSPTLSNRARVSSIEDAEVDKIQENSTDHDNI